MKIGEVLEYYGMKKDIAAAVGISAPSVSRWFKDGRVPYAQQILIESLTNGALKADKSVINSNPAGHSVTVVLNDAQLLKVLALGDGKRAVGIRAAIDAMPRVRDLDADQAGECF